MKPIASRDKIHSVCREIRNNGLATASKTTAVVEESRQQTPVEVCAQKAHHQLQRAVHVVVKAKRGMRKMIVNEFDIFVPVKR